MEKVQDLYMLPNRDFPIDFYFVKCVEAGINVLFRFPFLLQKVILFPPIKYGGGEKKAFHFSTYDEHLP